MRHSSPIRFLSLAVGIVLVAGLTGCDSAAGSGHAAVRSTAVPSLLVPPDAPSNCQPPRQDDSDIGIKFHLEGPAVVDTGDALTVTVHFVADRKMTFEGGWPMRYVISDDATSRVVGGAQSVFGTGVYLPLEEGDNVPRMPDRNPQPIPLVRCNDGRSPMTDPLPPGDYHLIGYVEAGTGNHQTDALPFTIRA